MTEFYENMLRHEQQGEGYLELILGPMFSGKTTQIIQIYNNYTYIGKKVVQIIAAFSARFYTNFHNFLKDHFLKVYTLMILFLLA